MTPPARLQPVQAWAVVNEAGDVQLLRLTLPEAEWWCRALNDGSAVLHVEPVTVRAWAPPTKKKGKR